MGALLTGKRRSSTILMKIDNSYQPRLRDGVDVYFESDNEVVFVFLSSRKRLKLKCHSALLEILPYFTGEFTIKELQKRLSGITEDVPANYLLEFVRYLDSKGILLITNWFDEITLPKSYKKRMVKQMNFLLDIVDGNNSFVAEVGRIQADIYNCRVCIFGLGSVGSWLCRELVMMGFRKFLLVDHDFVKSTDITRHAYFRQSKVGERKTTATKQMILDIDSSAEVECVTKPLNISMDIDKLLDGYDFIINSADEPYIGYTSIKLSRYCVKNSKPLFVCGGFDAHLGSLGELIIPGKTPCSDCYSTYFEDALKDWRPAEHPVLDRVSSFGGVVSMSAFSASTAAMSILRYFVDRNLQIKGGRGELCFENYEIKSFHVPRDCGCQICGGVKDEQYKI